MSKIKGLRLFCLLNLERYLLYESRSPSGLPGVFGLN